jgi:hypothetical protein
MSIVTLNDRAVRSVTAFGSLNTGSMVFIKKLTADEDSTVDFVDGSSNVVLDSTYKEYLFTFNNIHPANNDIVFQFNMSADGGSNYNVTKTTTVFRAYHAEGGGSTALEYRTGEDLAQGTGNQYLCTGQGNGNDESLVGTLHLFNPSSTTFVKHFIANFNNYHESDITQNYYIAGYANTTSAVNALQFSFGSGNIDAGDICLYGIL